MSKQITCDAVLTNYIAAALWSSTDDADDTGGEPLDRNYDADDLAPATLAAFRADCNDFIALCERLGLLARYTRGAEQFGHDFWLTRCHHGVGFWDRGDGELGDALTRAADTYGDAELYVGDDGLIYQAGRETEAAA